MVIEQRAGEQPALHAAAAIVATGQARIHLTPRRGAVSVVGAASAVREAAQGRAGREPAH